MLVQLTSQLWINPQQVVSVQGAGLNCVINMHNGSIIRVEIEGATTVKLLNRVHVPTEDK